jgi:hypothetical protein
MNNLKKITTLHELCEYARKNGLRVGGLKKYWFGVSIFDKTGDYFYTAQRSESQDYKKIKIQFDECFLKKNLDNLNI